MNYLKGIAAGLIAVAGCVALFTVALRIFYYDGRAIMGHFWFISLPVMFLIFSLGFCWVFRGASIRGAKR
jgi:hypothetical protein